MQKKMDKGKESDVKGNTSNTDRAETKDTSKYEMRARSVKTNPDVGNASKGDNTPKRRRTSKNESSKENPSEDLSNESPPKKKAKQTEVKKKVDREMPPTEGASDVTDESPSKKKAKQSKAKKKNDGEMSSVEDTSEDVIESPPKKKAKQTKAKKRKNVKEKLSSEDSSDVHNESPLKRKAKQTKTKQKNDEEKSSTEDSSEDVIEPSPKKKGKQTEAKKKGDGKKGKADKNSVEKENGEESEQRIKQEKKEVKSKKNKKKAEDPPVPRPIKYESLGDGPPSVPSTGCKYMGCHVSGAGGVWNAFENAEECSAKSFALFLRSQRQWAAKPLDDVTVEKWQKVSKGLFPHLVLPHGSYLMNLGSSNKDTLVKSRAMLVEEMKRCQRFGIPHYNFHPGSTLGQLSRVECCKLIAEGINLAHEQTEGVICVLENMCCQGFTIGGDLHELRTIIEHVKDRTRVGVCLDTCHAHAAGYDLSTKEGFQKLLDDFEQIIGWQFLRGLHINDSKGKAGDNLDRHERIGKGTIGLDGFRRIMNCGHFNDLPLILETPWTSNEGYAQEIKILEALIVK